MKKALLIFSLLVNFPFIAPCQILGCEPLKFEFNKIEWSFPLTVREAFEKHRLAYKPPGYYYKLQEHKTELILDFHYQSLDFDDEYQSKEVLFPRKLHSYIFQVAEQSGTYDSLRHVLEQAFNSKFILTKGLKDRNPTLRESERPFEFDFLTVSPCLTVGMKRSHSENKSPIVTVRFMYGLTLGYMGIIMGSY